MSDTIKKLGDAELEIMMILWRAEGTLTASKILTELKGRRDWPLSTLMTALSRLCEKGFVYCDRTTRTNLYSAMITEAAYKEKESRTFLAKLYGNSLQSFVATLYDAQAIDEKDLQELRELIDRIERSHHDA